MPDNKPPSDVVEVILAVDLNPSDPEEPINVNQVKVSPKGGENEGETKLIDELLEAVAKLDPDYAMAIGEAGKDNPRAAVRALQKLADNAPEDAQDEADSFDKAQSRKPSRSPEERYGHPKAEASKRPEFEDKGDWGDKPEKESFKPRRQFDDEGDDFKPKKKSGGFRGASERAFGKQPGDDFEPRKKDDEEEEF